MADMVIAPEERGMATITHLSGLAGYIVPFGGIIVPIIIWVMKKDSAVISSIAKQAIFLNIAVFVLILCGIVLAFTIILIPISIVGGIVLGIGAIALPVIGAVKASDGQYFKY